MRRSVRHPEQFPHVENFEHRLDRHREQLPVDAERNELGVGLFSDLLSIDYIRSNSASR